jgi:CheY-like chemotaxis protein
VPPDLPPAWCDRARVSQVLGILLSNAVKFSGEGDTVRLTAEARLPRTLVIHVADTGIGIDPAHQKRVFDKFFQVDSSMTRRYEGAGIGLSIAKSIAEAHGGAIELQSAPGEGSTFSLVLPDRLVYPPAGPPLGERERACLDGLHVIVIDDTPESRENLTAVLRQAGCTVAEKRSTFEGFRLAATHTPAVVLLPDTMADLPVREAAAVWSQQFAVQDAELLVHLDDDAPADLKMELDAAGAGWLRRPFSFEELVARLCGGAHAEYGESGISAEDA